MDVIVCLDACFTQKRRQPQGKAWHEPHTHPETVFIPPSEVKSVEDMVESIRPTPKKAEKKHKSPQKSSNPDSQEQEQNLSLACTFQLQCLMVVMTHLLQQMKDAQKPAQFFLQIQDLWL